MGDNPYNDEDVKVICNLYKRHRIPIDIGKMTAYAQKEGIGLPAGSEETIINTVCDHISSKKNPGLLGAFTGAVSSFFGYGKPIMYGKSSVPGQNYYNPYGVGLENEGEAAAAIPAAPQEQVARLEKTIDKKDIRDFDTLLQYLKIIPGGCNGIIPIIPPNESDYSNLFKFILPIADCYKDLNNLDGTNMLKNVFWKIIASNFKLMEVANQNIINRNIITNTFRYPGSETLLNNDNIGGTAEIINMISNRIIQTKKHTTIPRPMHSTDSKKMKMIKKAFVVYDAGDAPKNIFCPESYKVLITPGTIIDAAAKNITDKNVISCLPSKQEVDYINRGLNNKALLESYGLAHIICNLRINTFYPKVNDITNNWVGEFSFNINYPLDESNFSPNERVKINSYFENKNQDTFKEIKTYIEKYGNHIRNVFEYKYENNKITIIKKDSPHMKYFKGNATKNEYIETNFTKLDSRISKYKIEYIIESLKYIVTKLLGDVLQVMYVDLLIGTPVPIFGTIGKDNVFILTQDKSVVSNAFLHGYNVINTHNPNFGGYYNEETTKDIIDVDNKYCDGETPEVAMRNDYDKEEEEEEEEEAEEASPKRVKQTPSKRKPVYAAPVEDDLFTNLLNEAKRYKTTNIIIYNSILYIRYCLKEINKKIKTVSSKITNDELRREWENRFEFGNILDKTTHSLLPKIQKDEIQAAATTGGAAAATVNVESATITYIRELSRDNIDPDNNMIQGLNIQSNFKGALFSSGNMYKGIYKNQLYLLEFPDIFEHMNLELNEMIEIFIKYFRPFLNIIFDIIKTPNNYKAILHEFRPIFDYEDLDFSEDEIFNPSGTPKAPFNTYNIIINSDEQYNDNSASINTIKRVIETHPNGNIKTIEYNGKLVVPSAVYEFYELDDARAAAAEMTNDIDEEAGAAATATPRRTPRRAVTPGRPAAATTTATPREQRLAAKARAERAAAAADEMTNDENEDTGAAAAAATAPRTQGTKRPRGQGGGDPEATNKLNTDDQIEIEPSIKIEATEALEYYDYELYEKYAKTVPGFYTRYVLLNYPRILFMAYSILRYITKMPTYKNAAEKTAHTFHTLLLKQVRVFYFYDFFTKINRVFENYDYPDYNAFIGGKTNDEIKQMLSVYDTILYHYTEIVYQMMKKYNIIYEENEKLYVVLEKIASEKMMDSKMDPYITLLDADTQKQTLIENFYSYMFTQNSYIVHLNLFENVNVIDFLEYDIQRGRYNETMGPSMTEMLIKPIEDVYGTSDVKEVVRRNSEMIQRNNSMMKPSVVNRRNVNYKTLAEKKYQENEIMEKYMNATRPSTLHLLKPAIGKLEAIRRPTRTQRILPNRGTTAAAAAGGGIRTRYTRKKSYKK